jgi:hypothetical protein
MSRRSALHGNGRRGNRRRHLVLLLALGCFPIDTAMTSASPIEAGRSVTSSVAQLCGMHPMQRYTHNSTSPNAGGVDRVAT